MEAVATSLDAVAAKERGPLFAEGLTIGAKADDPPLVRMMPVHGPSRENRSRTGAVQMQNIASAPKDLCTSSGPRARPGQLGAQPPAQELRGVDAVSIRRERETVMSVAVARFLHVGSVVVGQSLGDQPPGWIDHSNGQARRGLFQVDGPSAGMTAVHAIDASDDSRPRAGSDQTQEAPHGAQDVHCGYHENNIRCGLVRRNAPVCNGHRLPTAYGLTIVGFADTP